MRSTNDFKQVRIIDFSETPVAVLEHHGDPQLIGNSIRKFIDWRKQNRLFPKISATFNILYNDPAEVAPEDYRLDICVATMRDLSNNSLGIVNKTSQPLVARYTVLVAIVGMAGISVPFGRETKILGE